MNRINQRILESKGIDELKNILELLEVQEVQWEYCDENFRCNNHKIPERYNHLCVAAYKGEAICLYDICSNCVYDKEKCFLFWERIRETGNKRIAFVDIRNLRSRINKRLEELESE